MSSTRTEGKKRRGRGDDGDNIVIHVIDFELMRGNPRTSTMSALLFSSLNLHVVVSKPSMLYPSRHLENPRTGSGPIPEGIGDKSDSWANLEPSDWSKSRGADLAGTLRYGVIG